MTPLANLVEREDPIENVSVLGIVSISEAQN